MYDLLLLALVAASIPLLLLPLHISLYTYLLLLQSGCGYTRPSISLSSVGRLACASRMHASFRLLFVCAAPILRLSHTISYCFLYTACQNGMHVWELIRPSARAF